MKKLLMIVAMFAAVTAFGAGQQDDQTKPDQQQQQEKPDQQPDQKPDQGQDQDQDQDQDQHDHHGSMWGHNCHLVTVEVCGLQEIGELCKTISYCHRPSTGVPAEPFNPSDEHMVRPAERHGIPAWLAALNAAFGGDRGGHGDNPSNPNFEAP